MTAPTFIVRRPCPPEDHDGAACGFCHGDGYVYAKVTADELTDAEFVEQLRSAIGAHREALLEELRLQDDEPTIQMERAS